MTGLFLLTTKPVNFQTKALTLNVSEKPQIKDKGKSAV